MSLEKEILISLRATGSIKNVGLVTLMSLHQHEWLNKLNKEQARD